MTKHVTCICRYTGVQTSSGDTASTEGLIEDEIGEEEVLTVHLEIPVHNPEPLANIVDRPEDGMGQAALPPLQSRRRNKATIRADKAQNVTLDLSNQNLDQAAARAQRAARRASRGEGQRTAEANSAETLAADADRDDQERAETEHMTKPELNNTPQNSWASKATWTLTWKKRGRPTPDTSDSKQ